MNVPRNWILTGSREFGVAGRNSDWDYVTLCNYGAVRMGLRMIPYNAGDGFVVYKHANVNVIVPCSKAGWNDWMAAHRHCVIERPKSKDRRRVIFDHYMYGTPLNRQKPIPKSDRWWFVRRRKAAV